MKTKEAIRKITESLHEGYSYLVATCDQTAELLALKLSYEEAWTVLEHLEHTYLTSYFLLLTLEKSVIKSLKRAPTQEYADDVGELSNIDEISQPKLFEWNPPKHMIPNRNLTPADIQEKLGEQEKIVRQLLLTIADGQGTLCKVSMSVRSLGKLDVYQWAYFLAQHAKYHVKYIKSIFEYYGKEV